MARSWSELYFHELFLHHLPLASHSSTLWALLSAGLLLSSGRAVPIRDLGIVSGTVSPWFPDATGTKTFPLAVQAKENSKKDSGEEKEGSSCEHNCCL